MQVPAGARLESLLANPSSEAAVGAGALGLAVFLGAAHALTPGHGKAVVAAYLVGSRGRILDAVLLGGVVTATHTASVFALGLATLYAASHVAVERIYPWLSLSSGLLVAGIGFWLLWRRLRVHPHTHPHTHAHPAPGWAGLVSLGVSGGLTPCPEALVVLLLSVTLRRVGYGLAVLVAFSLGLASVLILIGIAMVQAAPLARRLTGQGRLLHRLPVFSAALVSLLGVLLSAQAVLSMRQ